MNEIAEDIDDDEDEDLEIGLKEKITSLDVMLFSRQMYMLTKSGIPIMRALSGLQQSTPNRAFAGVIGDVSKSLDSGRELSMALAMHPNVFSQFYVSMVKVGESTGMLDQVYRHLARHIEFERFMRDQIKSALRYPGFVVTAMTIAIIIVNIFVVPAFAKVFDGFNAELPFMTKLLIGFSNFMVAFWPYMLISAVGGWFAFGNWKASAEGKPVWDEFKLRIPIAGKIIRKATMARFARSLAIALKSGVPILQSLSLVSRTVDNEFVCRKIETMGLGVERGESILKTALASNIFTPVVLQMIAVGEESGALDDILDDVANMYQEEVEYELKTLGAQIEPILIVFLGVLVLILALGVFLPIWDLGSAAIQH